MADDRVTAEARELFVKIDELLSDDDWPVKEFLDTSVEYACQQSEVSTLDCWLAMRSLTSADGARLALAECHAGKATASVDIEGLADKLALIAAAHEKAGAIYREAATTAAEMLKAKAAKQEGTDT